MNVGLGVFGSGTTLGWQRSGGTGSFLVARGNRGKTTPTLARYNISLPLYARRIAMSARQFAETGALPPPKAARLMPGFIKGETV
jgi:hypothetical protein